MSLSPFHLLSKRYSLPEITCLIPRGYCLVALSLTSLSIPNNPTLPHYFSPQLVAGGQFRVVKEPLGFVKVLQWVSVV